MVPWARGGGDNISLLQVIRHPYPSPNRACYLWRTPKIKSDQLDNGLSSFPATMAVLCKSTLIPHTQWAICFLQGFPNMGSICSCASWCLSVVNTWNLCVSSGSALLYPGLCCLHIPIIQWVPSTTVCVAGVQAFSTLLEGGGGSNRVIHGYIVLVVAELSGVKDTSVNHKVLL
jgi:hypothetical protein